MARKPLRKKQKQTPKCIAIDCETVNEKRNGLFTPHAGATAHNRYKYSIFCAPLFSFLIEKRERKRIRFLSTADWVVVGSHLASLKNYVLRLLLLSPSSPSSFLLFFLSFWYWRLVKIQNKLWLMVFPLISYTPFSYRFLSFFLCASSVVTYTRGYSSQHRWPFTYTRTSSH